MQTDTNHPFAIRRPLRANAVFSALTGALLTAAPAAVGGWLGVSIDGWLRALGIALLGHAVLLAFASTLANPIPLGRLNLAAIAPYPVLMIGLAVTGLVDRPLGQFLVLADGLIVGLIAVAHAAALRSTHPTPAPQLS